MILWAAPTLKLKWINKYTNMETHLVELVLMPLHPTLVFVITQNNKYMKKKKTKLHD